MTDSKTIATTLSALAHPSRVDLFKTLLAHHPNGVNAGHLSAKTGLAPSTLSHHLREMEKGGVIERCPVGQSTITTLNLGNLTKISATLIQLCCWVEQVPDTGEML